MYPLSGMPCASLKGKARGSDLLCLYVQGAGIRGSFPVEIRRQSRRESRPPPRLNAGTGAVSKYSLARPRTQHAISAPRYTVGSPSLKRRRETNGVVNPAETLFKVCPSNGAVPGCTPSLECPATLRGSVSGARIVLLPPLPPAPHPMSSPFRLSRHGGGGIRFCGRRHWGATTPSSIRHGCEGPELG